ncbi:MAG: diguanylate cyclase and metal dependent phosphohydrolase [Solirubrobacteraceae bacterium]|nr:diguanylate cyclase and metal dependent phosphohydrolase [Solirubrobacteraceae bacterium]
MGFATMPRAVRWALVVLGVWTAGYAIHSWLPSHPLDGSILGKYASDAVQMAAAVLVGLRALKVSGRERRAWLLMSAGMVVWTLGDLYWAIVLADMKTIPVPSPADVGYLLFVPLTFAGIVLLARARMTGVPRTLAIDGVCAALAVGAVSAAVVVQAVLSQGGTTREVIVNLAYPVTDMILMGLIIGAVAMRGWRLDRTWGLLALGTLAYWVTDSLYLVMVSKGTYVSPSPIDFGWTAAAVLYAVAAWMPVSRSTGVARRGRLREILLPVAFGLVGLSILIVASFVHVNPMAVALAAASLMAVMARLMITFTEHAALLRASREEALTDALTGLGNRRALTLDLEQALPECGDARPLVLVLFDLDGFKAYNDAFGHPAGDDLLARLGRNLSRTVDGRGRAYRMGGDEFCALIEPREEVAQPIVDAAAAALSEFGEGFSVGCSYGSITLPREATSSEEALRQADQRMYAAKEGGRASAGRQSTDVLLRALAERDPTLADHLADVAALAEAVAGRMGLPREDIERVRQAAELHDIGKVAIPDAILHKPAALDEHEWAFIRQHTLIGERIINAAPSLGQVAALVRSSHERFDGGGYPDGLAGADIPLGARIVAICDAFDAMTTDRSYRSALDPQAALHELRNCAGGQFDPVVVEAFGATWAAREARVSAHS